MIAVNYGPAAKFFELFTSKESVNFYIDLALVHYNKALEFVVGIDRVAIEHAKTRAFKISTEKFQVAIQ